MGLVSPIALATIGPAVAGARLFLLDGRPHIVAIAKASFGFVADAPMRPLEPARLVAGDKPDARSGGILAASDLLPFRPGADVTFIGCAYAPSRMSATNTSVRLAVVQPSSHGGVEGGTTLVDKTLDVMGPRTVTPSWPNAAPTAFTKLPIGYDLSLGGPGDPINPIGIGREPDARGRLRLPCLSYPPDVAARFEPVGLGPLASTWPVRRNLLSEEALAGIERATPELHTGIDLAFFHAAPHDQRTLFLRGDEWVYLERLHVGVERIASQLPSLRAVGRIHLPGGAEQPLAMRIDTLAIDGERARCDVVARGSFAVASQEDLRSLGVTVGFELPAELADEPTLEKVPTLVIDVPPPAKAAPEAKPRSKRGSVSWGARTNKSGTATTVRVPDRKEPPTRQTAPAPAPPRQSHASGGQSLGAAAPHRASTTLVMEPEPRAPLPPPGPLPAYALPPVPVPLPLPPHLQPGPHATEPAPPTVLPSGFARHGHSHDHVTAVLELPPSTNAPFKIAKPEEGKAHDGTDIPGAPWASGAAPLPSSKRKKR